MPSAEERTDGVDGAQWLVEGIKDGRYHLVDRWSPTDGPVRQSGPYGSITVSGRRENSEERTLLEDAATIRQLGRNIPIALIYREANPFSFGSLVKWPFVSDMARRNWNARF